MTEFIKVDEEYISSVVSNAAWAAAGVSLEEKRGGKKGDQPAKGKKGDKPDFTTGARKGDEDEDDTGKDFEREDSSVEVHECPLCESVLEEALSDEVIYEHVSKIQEALNSIEEKKKTEMKEQDDEDDTPDDEPDDIEEEAPRKAKLLKKIAAMKGSASN